MVAIVRLFMIINKIAVHDSEQNESAHAMIKRTISTFCLISLLTACADLTFTKENVMKVHQGMSSNEVLKLFGQPDSIDAAVCGKPPNQWNCTTWKYVFGDASFTFSGERNHLKLNNFNVGNMY